MKKYFVIGNPINHTLSPKLHNYWLKINNIEAIYDKKKLEEKDIKNLILEIRKEKINGVNVTIPFKNTIISFLDELSSEAESTQSVNTIYFNNKKVIGHNTDIDGFEGSLKNVNYDFANKSAFILGSGGVVSSIIFALEKIGINEIFVSNRTRSKAENLKKLFKNLKVLDWGEIPNFDIIINATSLGLNEDDKIDLDLSKIGNKKFFYDVIYNPEQTNFLKLGKELGNLTENGKMMFIYQAQKSFEKWHKVLPKVNREVVDFLND